MNRLCFKLIAMLTFSLFSITSFSQGPGPVFWGITGNGNTTAGTNFLGTTNNEALNFRTANVQRMRLTEFGRLGIANTNPQAMLHINGSQNLTLLTGEVFRTSCSGADTYWRMFAGAQRGAIFGLTGDNHFRMQSMTPNAKLIFHTSFTNPASQVIIDPASTERMSISQTERLTGAPGGSIFRTDNITRVAISERGYSPITNPLSLLHIGFNIGGNGGWRNWMDVGTFTNAQSDYVYVGLKDETPSDNWTDDQSAVIAWGDNQLVTSGDANRLRFVFTSLEGTSLKSANHHGLEVGRMTSNGINGRMGLGDFFYNTCRPTKYIGNPLQYRPFGGRYS